MFFYSPGKIRNKLSRILYFFSRTLTAAGNVYSAFLPGVLLSVFLLYCLVASTLYAEWPLNRYTLTSVVFGDNIDSFTEEECLLAYPVAYSDLIRTPVHSCDFCRNMSSVDRVSRLSAHDFERLYAYTGRPVIVTDATDTWRAMQTFNFTFLKQLYQQDSVIFKDEKLNDCQFFPWKSDFDNLKDVFEMSYEQAIGLGTPWYIGWSNCDAKVADILRDLYTKPYFLPDISLAGNTDWLFMGSPGYGAPIHIDYVDHTSWQSMIVGDKLWTIIPPSECYWQCGPKIEVIVKKGETIVINTNIWYHSTKILGDKMSIAIGSEYD